MSKPSKALPVDATGRVLITEAADTEVDTKQITVTSTPVKLTITDGPKRRKLLVERPLAAPDVVVYIGGDNSVSHTTGYPLYHLDQLELDVDDSAEVWAVTESDDGEVHIMEIQ